MEETCPSETEADFQLTTRRYIPEDETVHNHQWENLKSYLFYSFTFLQESTLWTSSIIHETNCPHE
jgi:hypothetical protein